MGRIRAGLVFGVWVLLVFVVVFGVVLNVPVVRAGGTIYIRADGSIDPPTAPISSVDNITYTFIDNINDSIGVERDNIVVDGAGYTVRGARTGSGIGLTSVSNVTIKGMEIREFGTGISLYYSSNNSIYSNILTSNYNYGILLYHSSENNISQNNFAQNGGSIYGYGPSDENSICDNKIANDYYGIVISGSNTSISGNNITAYYDAITLDLSLDCSISENKVTSAGFDGIKLFDASNNNNISSNIVSNTNCGISLGGSNNNTINNNNITNNELSIRLFNSSNSTISGNNITSNVEGIGLSDYSSNNSISGNNIANNDWGIHLWGYSNNNTIFGNNVIANGAGIQIDGSSNNVLRVNSVANNNRNFGVDGSSPSDFVNDVDASNTVDGKPVYYWIGKEDMSVPPDAGYVALVNCTRITVQGQNLTHNFQGALLAYTTRSTITKHNINNNYYGIKLHESSNNTVSGSNINNNYYGIKLWGSKSSNNVVYHNNFVDNTIQGDIYLSTSVWDDGYPSGGNYWSDYTGVDADGDGIGDTPYIIISTGANNQDRYPLMNPWPPLEHELSASITVPASTKLGSPSFLNATVNNLGVNDETAVELVILINGTMIDSTTVMLLQVDHSYTLSHLWTPSVQGTYNVTSYVPPLSEEINRENNQATAFVTVSAQQPPVASFMHSPTAPIAGKTVTFDASASYDPDGSIISHDWEFGDGTTGSGKTVTHAYANAGAYTVTLTVTDNEDATDTETSTITILIAPKVGVKTGDWIKCTYTISGWPAGTPYPEWLKMEFTSVEGTTATVRVTMRMSNGTELSETVPVDMVAGGQALGLSGFVIPANSTTGDSINFGGLGFIVSTATIEGETTRTYAGVSRTVVYASISQYGTQLTYYWDKQTGVMVEASTTSGSLTATGKATETNMWQAQPQQEAFPIWIIGVAVAAIVLVAATILFLRKRKQPTENTTNPLSSA